MERCRVCEAEVKVQIMKNTGYCCAKHQRIGALLARYRELQALEGVTIADESAIAREQGETWRAYVEACDRAGVEHETSENPRLAAW